MAAGLEADVTGAAGWSRLRSAFEPAAAWAQAVEDRYEAFLALTEDRV